MTPDEMEALIGAHLRAEGNGDPDGAVANNTEDVEHDVVGFPGSPLRGISAALEFTGSWSKRSVPTARNAYTYYADDAVVIENLMTATDTGQFLGIPGTASKSGSASCTSSSSVTTGSPERTCDWTALRWPLN